MRDITLQDIITKKLNLTTSAPDDLICDAYYKMVSCAASNNQVERVNAYIDALVALEANKQCGTAVPNLEKLAMDLLKDSGMTVDDVVDCYLKNEE